MNEAQLYSDGIKAFNDGKFFLAHEILESLYHTQSGGKREFTQGLIQIAVAFYHLERDNKVGAAKLFKRGLPRLKDNNSYCPEYDVTLVIECVDNLIIQLSQNDEIKFSLPSIALFLNE